MINDLSVDMYIVLLSRVMTCQEINFKCLGSRFGKSIACNKLRSKSFFDTGQGAVDRYPIYKYIMVENGGNMGNKRIENMEVEIRERRVGGRVYYDAIIETPRGLMYSLTYAERKPTKEEVLEVWTTERREFSKYIN